MVIGEGGLEPIRKVLEEDVPLTEEDRRDLTHQLLVYAEELSDLYHAATERADKMEAANAEVNRTLDLLRKADEHRRKLLAALVRAEEEERKRIASDVYDDPIQVMAAVGMRLHAVRALVSDPKSQEMIERLAVSVEEAIERLRFLLFELRPRSLDREGLAAALREYLEVTFSQASLEYEVENELRVEPPEEIRSVIYRIAREAFANVRRHAKAKKVNVLLRSENSGVLARVRDDGVGFALSEAETNRPGHLGLSACAERAEMAGGWFRIDSAPGAGTTAEFWVPLPG